MYFFEERRPGWYRWSTTWPSEPVFPYIDEGVVAVRWLDVIEYTGALPLNYDQYCWYDNDDEGVMIMGVDFAQHDDN